jgi:hypothetical protein
MLVEAGHPLIEEAFAPEADDIAADGERGGDVVIRVPFGGREDHERPHHLKVWQRIFVGTGL